MDFTSQYNTQLAAEDEAAFTAWAQQQQRLADLQDYDLRGFWKAGNGFAENGHGTDEFKKPNHPTFSNESMYSGQDGYIGGAWSQDGQGANVFTPSSKNMEMWPEQDLRNYFDQREPGVKLVIPQASAALTPAAPGEPVRALADILQSY